MLKWLKGSPGPSMPIGTRAYAIGDVHGRLDLFDALLNDIRDDNSRHPQADVVIILLGDLIDRGPDSRGVISRARAGFSWARTVAIMGNHESVMLDALDGHLDTLRNWLSYGGMEALRSWGVPDQLLTEGTLGDILDAARQAVSQSERKWLQQMRQSLRLGDYYFVHAGIRPGVPLDKQIDDDRMWIREEFLDSRRKHGAMIVHGHSIKAEVEERPNRIGLDTGAYMTGRLTALGLEGNRRWLLST